jgi:hypothetical protein
MVRGFPGDEPVMTILATIYASAPADEVILHALELRHPTAPSTYICGGFADVTATLETGEAVLFRGMAIDVALPPEDASGNQSLMFAIDNVVDAAQGFIDSAMEAGGEVVLVLRKYLMSDLSQPAELPLEMPVIGGAFEGSTLQVRAALHDLLNTAWPRERYTADYSPGVRYAA